MLGVKAASDFKVLVGTNLHSRLPRRETGLTPKCLLRCPLFQSAAYLPCTQTRELHNQKRANDER